MKDPDTLLLVKEECVQEANRTKVQISTVGKIYLGTLIGTEVLMPMLRLLWMNGLKN